MRASEWPGDTGAARTGKQMLSADKRGFLPKTRLNGDSASAVRDGVIFIANEISVSRFDHSGAEGLEHRILSSLLEFCVVLHTTHWCVDDTGSCVSGEFVGICTLT